MVIKTSLPLIKSVKTEELNFEEFDGAIIAQNCLFLLPSSPAPSGLPISEAFPAPVSPVFLHFPCSVAAKSARTIRYWLVEDFRAKTDLQIRPAKFKKRKEKLKVEESFIRFRFFKLKIVNDKFESLRVIA